MEDHTQTPPCQLAELQTESNSTSTKNHIVSSVERQGVEIKSYAPLKPAFHDLLTIFPEARASYLLPKMRELESAVAEMENAATKKLERSKHIADGWFIRELTKATKIASLVDLKRQLQRLRRYLPQPQSKGHLNQDRIERAKKYPIVEIAEVYIQNIKRCGRAWRSLCPYHDERTPSFYLYPDTSTFHCFGYQEHGDVIALTQKLLSVGFIEAAKYLTPYYES